jgi:hypothetical protein
MRRNFDDDIMDGMVKYAFFVRFFLRPYTGFRTLADLLGSDLQMLERTLRMSDKDGQ